MARAMTHAHMFTAALVPETWIFEDAGRHAHFRAWFHWADTVGTENVAVTQRPHSTETTTYAIPFSPFGAAGGDDWTEFGGECYRVTFVTGGVWAVGATLTVRVVAWNEGEEMPLDTGVRPAVP